MDLKNCRCCNVRRHKEINNGEQYIVLEIYLELGTSDKREISSLGPKYYVRRSSKGLTTSLTLKTRKISSKKKKTGTVNTKDSYQDFVKITEEFESTPSQNFRYTKNHVKNPNRRLFICTKATFQDNQGLETHSKERKDYSGKRIYEENRSALVMTR